jgi:hypothetical protein
VVAAISLSIAVFIAALAVWGLVLAVVGRPPDRTYLAACWVGQAELVLQAAAALIAMAAGHRPDATGEYLGYLVITVSLLPFALLRARDAQEPTRWESATIAAVAFAVAVAVVRLLSLW